MWLHKKQEVIHRTHRAYLPTAQTSSCTNLVLWMLYFGNTHFQSNSKTQFSSWVGVLGCCVDDHRIRYYLGLWSFIICICKFDRIFLLSSLSSSSSLSLSSALRLGASSFWPGIWLLTEQGNFLVCVLKVLITKVALQILSMLVYWIQAESFTSSPYF
jgi:hypothetical protein